MLNKIVLWAFVLFGVTQASLTYGASAVAPSTLVPTSSTTSDSASWREKLSSLQLWNENLTPTEAAVRFKRAYKLTALIAIAIGFYGAYAFGEAKNDLPGNKFSDYIAGMAASGIAGFLAVTLYAKHGKVFPTTEPALVAPPVSRLRVRRDALTSQQLESVAAAVAAEVNAQP